MQIHRTSVNTLIISKSNGNSRKFICTPKQMNTAWSLAHNSILSAANYLIKEGV